ncbi:MAG: hypothetical protein WDN00_17220 [Limisphaerales bacterium]
MNNNFTRMIQSQTTPDERLAVCTWSLQPASPQELVEKLSVTKIPTRSTGARPVA